MRISGIETPALLVDVDCLEANLDRMAHLARIAGLDLRPHVKTHKTPQIAQLQLERGAVGITVAKIGEAEVMADAGINDIFIAHQVVSAEKIERLISLTHRIKLSVGVDSAEAAAPLSSAFAQQGIRLPVLIEMDIGLYRSGVAPEGVMDLARRINSLPGLRLTGLYTFPGQVYCARNENEVAGLAAHEARSMAEVAERIKPLSESHRVSGGSTPTARHYQPECGLTEIRPGTYVFNDRSQIDLWSAGWGDCALTILASVVSAPEANRAVLDVGSKALSSDRAPATAGYGVLKEDHSTIIATLYEEHGVVDLSSAGIKLRVGDKVEIIPNHACTACNLFDEIQVIRDREVVDTWQIAARGKLR